MTDTKWAEEIADYCLGRGGYEGHAEIVAHLVKHCQPQTDALKMARERITEWCDAVAVEWGQGSQTHNVARDGRDIVLAALKEST